MQEAGYRQVVAKINPVRFIRLTLLERYADDACSYKVTGRDYTIKNTINTVGIYFSLPGVTNPHFTCSKSIGGAFHLTAEVTDNGRRILRKFNCSMAYTETDGVSLGTIYLSFAPNAFDNLAWNATGREYNRCLAYLNDARKK